jgi:hypothetical protein
VQWHQQKWLVYRVTGLNVFLFHARNPVSFRSTEWGLMRIPRYTATWMV